MERRKKKDERKKKKRKNIRFKASDPEELRHFKWRMEDLWEEAGIKDYEKKKETLGKYADVVSEEEWKELRTFESGS